MWEKIDCSEPGLSVEDIIRLVLLTDGADHALKVVNTNAIDEDASLFMESITIPNDETVFFSSTAYEITGAELWTEVDKLVKNLKGTGAINSTYDFWTDAVQFLPVIGGDATRHAVNLRSPGTKDIPAFNGTWVHSGSGAKPNGSTGYASTGISPQELDAAGVNFGRYNGTTASAETKTQMGAWNGSQGWFIHHASNLTTYTLAGITTQAQNVDFLSAGMQMVNGLNGVTKGSRRGFRVSSLTQTANTTITAEITHNCMQHNNGTRSLFSACELRFGHVIGRSLSEQEQIVFNEIIESFQTNLNRQYVAKRAYFHGDSTTLGNGLAGGNPARWTSLIASNKGWAEINRGIDGATLQNAVTVNRIAGPNMYDVRDDETHLGLFFTIPEYDADQDGMFCISFSINDTGLTYAGYTPANFASQLGEIIDAAIAKGWPAEKIVCVIGLYCDEALNCWDFYITLETPNLPLADNVRHEAIIDAAEAVAISKGVVWASPYQAMIDAGITYISNDGRHPNAAGHTVIANYVLTQITGIT